MGAAQFVSKERVVIFSSSKLLWLGWCLIFKRYLAILADSGDFSQILVFLSTSTVHPNVFPKSGKSALEMTLKNSPEDKYVECTTIHKRGNVTRNKDMGKYTTLLVIK